MRVFSSLPSSLTYAYAVAPCTSTLSCPWGVESSCDARQIRRQGRHLAERSCINSRRCGTAATFAARHGICNLALGRTDDLDSSSSSATSRHLCVLLAQMMSHASDIACGAFAWENFSNTHQDLLSLAEIKFVRCVMADTCYLRGSSASEKGNI